jgi:hypothetical protein
MANGGVSIHYVSATFKEKFLTVVFEKIVPCRPTLGSVKSKDFAAELKS